MRSGLRLLGLLALCALLVACGGGKTATATATRTPTVATTPSPAAPTALASPTPSATPTVAVAATVVPPTIPPVVPTRTPSAAPTASAAPAMTPAASNTVLVELKDFAIALDTTVVKAGPVTFRVKNNGPSPHTFNVRVGDAEPGVKALDPGTVATVTLILSPGTYTYRCMIPGHDLLGMKGMLTVQ